MGKAQRLRNTKVEPTFELLNDTETIQLPPESKGHIVTFMQIAMVHMPGCIIVRVNFPKDGKRHNDALFQRMCDKYKTACCLLLRNDDPSVLAIPCKRASLVFKDGRIAVRGEGAEEVMSMVPESAR